MTIDEIIKEIDSKAMGRTRYAGQEMPRDEALVAEIRSLREAVRVLADGWRWEKSLPYNPIASAAVEAARNQTKGPQ